MSSASCPSASVQLVWLRDVSKAPYVAGGHRVAPVWWRKEAEGRSVWRPKRRLVYERIFWWLMREKDFEFQDKMGYTSVLLLDNKMLWSETCTKGADIFSAARQRPPTLLSSSGRWTLTR